VRKKRKSIEIERDVDDIARRDGLVIHTNMLARRIARDCARRAMSSTLPATTTHATTSWKDTDFGSRIGPCSSSTPRWTRGIGSRGVPDEYGQPATGGTGFLGTPKNHRELLERRPLSPDVFAADGGWSAHYKFPPVALSSITNRVTGVVLSGAMSAGGVIALVGGPEAVPATMEAFKAAAPFAVVPAKFALSFPFVFHTLGGFRHLFWDATTRGIDNESANTSSLAMFGVSAVASAALAAYSW
jgi:succinate dehydrogenase (ubiquinone) cytochrome b560 subunit